MRLPPLLSGVEREAIAEVLEDAAREFETREFHIGFGLARGAWGRKVNGDVCDWSSDLATSVCVVGALMRVESRRPLSWVMRTETRQALKAYIGETSILKASITRWSDELPGAWAAVVELRAAAAFVRDVA